METSKLEKNGQYLRVFFLKCRETSVGVYGDTPLAGLLNTQPQVGGFLKVYFGFRLHIHLWEWYGL